jgi:hypothetical protein
MPDMRGCAHWQQQTPAGTGGPGRPAIVGVFPEPLLHPHKDEQKQAHAGNAKCQHEDLPDVHGSCPYLCPWPGPRHTRRTQRDDRASRESMPSPTSLPAEKDLEAWTPDQITVKATWPHPPDRRAMTITLSAKDGQPIADGEMPGPDGSSSDLDTLATCRLRPRCAATPSTLPPAPPGTAAGTSPCTSPAPGTAGRGNPPDPLDAN